LWFDTPDLTAVVEEIVDRPGWASGSALAFLVESDPETAHYIDAWAYDGSPGLASRVEICYVADGPGNTATPTSTTEPSSTPTPTPTTEPSSTPTPTPELVSIVLQPGLDGYDGARDTYLSRSGASLNFGGSSVLSLGGDGAMKTLLKFDVPPPPEGAQLSEANLGLYTTQRTTDEPLVTQAYMLQRPWSEEETTWRLALDGEQWSQEGCEGEGDDYDRQAVAVSTLTTDQEWYAWDVTQAVRRWLEVQETNRGLVLWSQGSESMRYNLASAQNPHQLLRPRLTITYTLPPSQS
jgi:hypothetical protein